MEWWVYALALPVIGGIICGVGITLDDDDKWWADHVLIIVFLWPFLATTLIGCLLAAPFAKRKKKNIKPVRDTIAEAIVEANLVSHSNAFPIADIVLRVVGNGAIKALEAENARLRKALERLRDMEIVEQEMIIDKALDE